MTKNDIREAISCLSSVERVRVNDDLGCVIVEMEYFGPRCELSEEWIESVMNSCVIAGVLWLVVARQWRWRWLRHVLPGKYMSFLSFDRGTP